VYREEYAYLRSGRPQSKSPVAGCHSKVAHLCTCGVRCVDLGISSLLNLIAPGFNHRRVARVMRGSPIACVIMMFVRANLIWLPFTVYTRRLLHCY
jgi:hypothetical protein